MSKIRVERSILAIVNMGGEGYAQCAGRSWHFWRLGTAARTVSSTLR